MIRTDGVYIISFSSTSSCIPYDLAINLDTGYWQVESISDGYIYDEGHLMPRVKDCTNEELNTFSYNIITNFIRRK
jgi:hypothetical protein